MILAWPKHLRYRCDPGCDKQGCMFCDGGLFSCVRCKGFEGSLPTDCPGERMSEVFQDRVYAGEINYIHPYGWLRKGDRQFKEA